ncbi:LppP/LprE family lipoprotein [Nocardia mexicana]|uniref:LppP/LprE lipoprotein n=1 Tax=Nocardia mexicana TaxID=279262 RepID=A0A370H6G6_9NOCA|nr:LppP/LprE family lipoprotein [Nocardia mexicana]RDI51082.1 LppP/LprE lipoprotein [Nocardia mexicana]
MFRTTVVTAAVAAVLGALVACGSSSGPSAATSGPTSSDTGSPASAAPQRPSTAPAAGPASCGIDLSSPVVRAAVAQLPAEPATQAPWNTNPATFEGNFDPCVTLSAAIVTIEGATGSSPQHALLFHRGEYIGTATAEAYGFTTLAAAASTDDTVVLDYKTPGSCNACDDGTHTQVGFHWDGRRVVMNGTPPN